MIDFMPFLAGMACGVLVTVAFVASRLASILESAED